MERFLLYLDNLDDLFFALRFAGERRARLLLLIFALGAAGAATTLAALPDASLGAAWLLVASVLLLYQAARVLHPSSHLTD